MRREKLYEQKGDLLSDVFTRDETAFIVDLAKLVKKHDFMFGAAANDAADSIVAKKHQDG